VVLASVVLALVAQECATQAVVAYTWIQLLMLRMAACSRQTRGAALSYAAFYIAAVCMIDSAALPAQCGSACAIVFTVCNASLMGQCRRNAVIRYTHGTHAV
jgi:hypothetical protein